MARLTVLIPYFGDISLLEQTLISVLENRPVDSEIVVAHDGSYEDSYDLSDEVKFTEVNGKPSVGRFLDRVLSETDSEYVHTLLPGILAKPGWCDAIDQHFEDSRVGSICPIISDFQDDGKVKSVGIKADIFFGRKVVGQNFRIEMLVEESISPLGPSIAAAFYRRSALEQIGQFSLLDDASIDLEIALSLREVGFKTVIHSTSSLVAQSDAMEIDRNSIRAGMNSQRTIWRHVRGESVAKACAISFGAMLFEAVASFSRPSRFLNTIGRLESLSEINRHRAFHQLLQNARGPEASDSAQCDHPKAHGNQHSTSSDRKAA